MNSYYFEKYIWFLKERMSIWHKKEILELPPPWTKDYILDNAFFTNIYRELDRNSRYELMFLSQTPDPKEQLFKICLFRHSNSISTFEFLLENPNASSEDIWEYRESVSGKEFFSDAMMSPPGKDPETGERMSRPDWVLFYRNSLREDLDSLYQDVTSAESADECLSRLKSKTRRIGPFFAYEFYTSLTYCSWFSWTEDDAYVIGPGAWPMMNFLEEDSLEVIREALYERLLRESDYVWIPEKYQPRNPTPHKFTLRTTEHSLCESRKWLSLDSGKKARRTFRFRPPLTFKGLRFPRAQGASCASI